MALVLLAAFMLASINGWYAWPYVPALLAAATLFLLSGARIATDRGTRALDLVIIAALAYIALQLAALPAGVLGALSPSTPALQDAYALAPFGDWRPLSIQPAATRSGLTLALTAALMFWTARVAFSRGGSRAATRLIAWIGFACALVSLAQRATAPMTVLWRWTLPGVTVATFGPFVNRDHLATWLVLATSVVAGYLLMHVHAHAAERLRRGTHAVMVALTDSTALVVLGALGAMLLTLAATLSRSGFIALVTAAVVATRLARPGRAASGRVGVAAAVLIIGLAAWMNMEGLSDRIVSTVASPATDRVGRLVIWRETARIIGSFPLFGTGQGTYADTMFILQQRARPVLFNQAHDEYLQLATEGGIVMLSLVLAGGVLLARAARQRLAGEDGSHRFIRIGAVAGLSGIAVQSIWETGLRAPANLLLAAIVAAMAVADRTLHDDAGHVHLRADDSETTPA